MYVRTYVWIYRYGRHHNHRQGPCLQLYPAAGSSSRCQNLPSFPLSYLSFPLSYLALSSRMPLLISFPSLASLQPFSHLTLSLFLACSLLSSSTVHPSRISRASRERSFLPLSRIILAFLYLTSPLHLIFFRALVCLAFLIKHSLPSLPSLRSNSNISFGLGRC